MSQQEGPWFESWAAEPGVLSEWSLHVLLVPALGFPPGATVSPIIQKHAV